MSLFNLLKKSIRFYWRTSVGVCAAMVVSTAVLVGALVVGDSVRYSLARLVDVRLGKVGYALISQDRFFTAELADKVSPEAAAVLQLRGMAANDEGSKRVNKVSVLGVDGRFFALGDSEDLLKAQGEVVVVNDALAGRLGVNIGDEILIRIAKPSLMPRDVVLTPSSDATIAFRVKVVSVAGQDQFGRFGLQADQSTPLNAFISRDWLAEKIGQAGRANLMLDVGEQGQLRDIITLEDAELNLAVEKDRGWIEARSRRVFIGKAVEDALLNAYKDATGILTYFVNELRLGDKATPYSMVTAMGGTDQSDDEIVITDWLAEDIGAKVGDEIELKYFVAQAGKELIEKSSRFKVSKIQPIFIDPTLMPDFPGLSDEENCRDWDPGIPVDLDKIRDKDEAYWDKFKGTPKAYITLTAGQKIWGNRFGKLTAVRYSAADNTIEDIKRAVLSKLDAADVGLYFQDVRGRGQDASTQGTDFGGLFIGLSMFLIAAAVVLTSLVFVFGVERRVDQAGIMAAVGFTPKQVKRAFLLEGGLLALVGSIAGSAVGLLYTKATIYGLSTVWADAVAGSEIQFHASVKTVAIGVGSSFVLSMITILLSVRKHLKLQVRQLLSGVRDGVSKQKSMFRIYILAGIGVLHMAVAISVAIKASGNEDAAGSFFTAGGMMLGSGVIIASALLKGLGAKVAGNVKTIRAVAVRNSIRRSGRSLAVIMMLATGSFLVVAVGANRHDISAEAMERHSGTGGFALVAEATIPVVDAIERNEASVVRMRVRDGDDASCLNLNRAQRPRVLGVESAQLVERDAFGFKKTAAAELGSQADWSLLDIDMGEGILPAVGDYSSVVWAMGKSLGGEIKYVSEQGQVFKLVIVGIINNSVLQGNLLISEKNFVEKFPSEEGYRAFLIDAPFDISEQIGDELSSQFRDFGFEVQSAAAKLAQFGAVENTYLSIFQLLGGLALMIGSIGLGLVVLINVLDRRGELAMMRAVGFSRDTLKKMVLLEHVGLLGAGIFIGVFSAIIAVWPALLSPGASVPYLSLLVTIAAILVSGVVWIWVASSFALSGELMEALRSE